MTLNVHVGVLALQGSFREHMTLLQRLDDHVLVSEVRTEEQLQAVDALVIPGGESTTMALIAERWGLLPALQKFAADGKPMWGTCAGLIFLANRATGMKEGGQALIGGIDCFVHRNFFGAQINSFEAMLPTPACIAREGEDPAFRAVFIRAPAITEVGPSVKVLATYTLTKEELRRTEGRESVIIAVQSNNLMATSFHPELTADSRWHRYFVELVRNHVNACGQAAPKASVAAAVAPKSSVRPLDMPIY
jgi:5'-phosphate synthase pdxT subunit